MSSPTEIYDQKIVSSVKKIGSDDQGKLFEALAKAQLDMCAAKTDKINPYFKSKYADFSSVVRSSRPSLSKNGLCVIQRMDSKPDGSLLMCTMLCHSSGQWIGSDMLVKPLKGDIQSMGSYLTYIKRYSYSAITGVVTTDEDDDGEAAMNIQRKEIPSKVKKISQDELKVISDMLTLNRDLIGTILKQFNIIKFSDLDADRFKDCVSFIFKLKKEKE